MHSYRYFFVCFLCVCLGYMRSFGFVSVLSFFHLVIVIGDNAKLFTVCVSAVEFTFLDFEVLKRQRRIQNVLFIILCLCVCVCAPHSISTIFSLFAFYFCYFLSFRRRRRRRCWFLWIFLLYEQNIDINTNDRHIDVVHLRA